MKFYVQVWKQKGPISFKSAESVASSHQFKTIHRLYKKKFFHKTTFLPVSTFFHRTSLVQISKNNETSLYRSSSLLLNPFPFENLIYGNSVKGNLKLDFQLGLDKANDCIFFLNCYRQHDLRFLALIIRTLSLTFNGILVRLKMEKSSVIVSLVSSSQ